MTIADVAQELNISYAHARCLVLSPGFPMFRIGRRPLVHPADFARWRERHYGCTVAARPSKPKVGEHKKRMKRKYPDGHNMWDARQITRDDFYS